MKWTKILPDGKGGYNLFDNWTHGDEIMMRITPILILLPIILLFSLLLPAIFWIIIPLSYTKENHQNTYFGLAVSLLFFLDYWLGGPLWIVFKLSQAESVLYFFGALHVVFVTLNIARLFVYRNNTETPGIMLFLALFLMMFYAYDGLINIAEAMSSSTPCFWLEDYYNKEMGEILNNPYNTK